MSGVPFRRRKSGSPSDGKPSRSNCARVRSEDSNCPRLGVPGGGPGSDAICVSVSPSWPASGRLKAFSAHSSMFSQIFSAAY